MLGVSAAAPAGAQDPFEIQVYEYETVARGRWDLETHVNYTARGIRDFSGFLLAFRHDIQRCSRSSLRVSRTYPQGEPAAR